jgi:hypothetical protein
MMSKLQLLATPSFFGFRGVAVAAMLRIAKRALFLPVYSTVMVPNLPTLSWISPLKLVT